MPRRPARRKTRRTRTSGPVTARRRSPRPPAAREAGPAALRADPEAVKTAMLEAALDAIVAMDHEGRVIEFNLAAERLFGYRRAEALGRSMAELIIPERLREDHRRGLERFVAGASGARVGKRTETPAMRADGSEIQVELSVCCLSLAGPPIFVGFIRDLSGQRSAEDALRRNEALFRALIERSSDMVTILEPDGTIRYQSPSVCRILGHDPAAMVGRHLLEFVHPEDATMAEAELAETLADPRASRMLVVRALARDGSCRVFEAIPTNRVSDPAIRGIVVNSRDVTDRHEAEDALRRSEEQLRHAQRLEAVGRLAGGVAHDFNNLLTVILAYSDVQRTGLEPGHPLHQGALEIHKAAERGAALTRQLLAFSRRQVMEPSRLDLNAVVTDLAPMLRRLIGEDVDLLLHLEDGLGHVQADRAQIEQVLMNLVVNSRDAMPEGGRVAITTENHTPRLGGRWVALEVGDSGSGMDDATRARIFEPFFTTKERGRGTGLGLSTVYGIVQQSGGRIEVESAPGEGSTFRILLPRATARSGGPHSGTAFEPDAGERARDLGGAETVLLVEDEDVVRGLMSEVLRLEGYRVLEASNGEAALEVVEALENEIHLLLTDVVMPGMSGGELAERVRELRPSIQVLFVSGYTDDQVARRGVLDQSLHLLQKPFTPRMLANKVRELLDCRRAA